MATKNLIFFRASKKLNHFAEFINGFVYSGNVIETYSKIFLGIHFSTTATKCHWASSSSKATHHEKKSQCQQSGQHQHWHIVSPRARWIFISIINFIEIKNLRQLPLRILTRKFGSPKSKLITLSITTSRQSAIINRS